LIRLRLVPPLTRPDWVEVLARGSRPNAGLPLLRYPS
jgi:hypothetical protein